jgi:phage minor structural protein
VVIILYLLDRNVQTVKWNGQPLHEATKAEVEEVTNVSYTLKVDYPITDTEIYKKFQEDMLIIAPTPITGRQLFRIKEISEQDDTVNLTCQHITEDIFKRSVRPIKVSNSTCQIALNAMISAVKTPLGKFSFTSNIMDNRTFNTTEDETLYKILMDGKHSIVGAWEGEMIRDNFLIDIPKSRGIDRGVVITTHQNLKQYERNKSSSSIITRLHLKSTFKPEGAEEDTVLKVTVDSPLIGNYPYINEAEYENNDLTTEEELRKWGEAKFKNGDIDKSTDQIKVEAYELDGQTVHLGDTVTIMSLKHDVMLKKKAVGYVYDALSEEYISLTFDDKAGHGGGMSGSNGISDVASEILDTVQKTQEDDEYYKKLKVLVDNANRAFEDKAGALKKEITDGIEQAKAQAEVIKQEISGSIDQKISEANTANKSEIKEEFNAKYGDITVEMDQIKSTAELLKSNDKEIKGIIENLNVDFSTQLFNIQGEQARYKTETDKSIADLIKVSDSKADRAYVEQTAKGLKEQFSSFTFSGGPNLIRNSGYKDGLKYFFGTANRFRLGTHPFYYNGSKPIAVIFNDSTNEVLYQTNRFDLERNTDYVLNFRGFNNSSLTSCEVFVLGRKKDETQNYTVIKHLLKPTKLSGQGVEDVSLTFNSGEIDNAYVRFDNNGSSGGQADLYIAEIDLYKGTNKRPWQPAPEDQEYIVTQAQASFERTAQGLTQKVTALEASADGLASKIAEYKQTADGQFATITSQLGDMLKKTDINITDGRISFGTGKSIDGRTISSLLVQEPESIALIAKLIKVNGDMVVDGSILGRHIASESVETGHMKAGSVTTPILASNSVTADKVLVDSAMIDKLVSNQAFIRELASQRAFITQLTSVGISANDIRGGRLTANSGVSSFDLDNGRLSFYDNFTGVFRDQANASSQGLFFRNDDVAINGRRYINSKAIIGADRRDNDIRSHWDQGGFNGMIVDTIKGVGTGDHDNADKVTFVGDRFNFTHSYNYDQATGSNPYGWRITTWGGTTIAPYGTNGRNTNIQAGDFLLINNGNNGVWLRQALRTLRTALQHFVNAGFATDDFTPQNGKPMRTALHSSIRNAVANSLRDFDKFGI